MVIGEIQIRLVLFRLINSLRYPCHHLVLYFLDFFGRLPRRLLLRGLITFWPSRFDCHSGLRLTRARLRPRRASSEAWVLPAPSVAPVTTAHRPDSSSFLAGPRKSVYSQRRRKKENLRTVKVPTDEPRKTHEGCDARVSAKERPIVFPVTMCTTALRARCYRAGVYVDANAEVDRLTNMNGKGTENIKGGIRQIESEIETREESADSNAWCTNVHVPLRATERGGRRVICAIFSKFFLR